MANYKLRRLIGGNPFIVKNAIFLNKTVREYGAAFHKVCIVGEVENIDNLINLNTHYQSVKDISKDVEGKIMVGCYDIDEYAIELLQP